MKNTTLCYIEQDGKYLLLHRTKKQNDENKNKWIGIGGKFLDGESPKECVLREIKEETNLTPRNLKYRGIITFVMDGVSEYMHLFTANGYTGEISKDCKEGELAFVDKHELLNLPLWEGDKIFLRLLETEERFFSLKLIYDVQGNLISHSLDF